MAKVTWFETESNRYAPAHIICRWSNGYSFAVEFQIDQSNFASQFLEAIMDARTATAKHSSNQNGKLTFYQKFELHVKFENQWIQTGAFVASESTLNGSPLRGLGEPSEWLRAAQKAYQESSAISSLCSSVSHSVAEMLDKSAE